METAKPKTKPTGASESKVAASDKSAGDSARKPAPLQPTTSRAVCPVCGKPSYSRTGIHPQCSQQQAEAALKLAQREQAVEAPPVARQPWIKSCPKCRRQLPARRVKCECGYTYPQLKPTGSTS